MNAGASVQPTSASSGRQRPGHARTARIQVIVDEAEREAFRQRAARAGVSLSAWLREAGRRRLDDDASGRITTVEELRTFFANCQEEGDGPEPDWEDHLATMDRSRRSGLPEP